MSLGAAKDKPRMTCRIRTDDTEHGYLLHIGACLGDRLL